MSAATRARGDGQRLALYACQQAPVDAGHGRYASPAPGIEQWQQLQSLFEPGIGPAALERHEPGRLRRRTAEVTGAADRLGVLAGQVDAPEGAVLEDVPQDVRELQGDAEGIREGDRLLGLA